VLNFAPMPVIRVYLGWGNIELMLFKIFRMVSNFAAMETHAPRLPIRQIVFVVSIGLCLFIDPV